MRSRDVTIPLALWICAAICAHFMFGTGGLVVAQMYDDRSLLWKLSRQAAGLAKRSDQTFEVTLGEPSEEPKDEPPAPKAENQPTPTAEVAKTPPKPEAKKERPPVVKHALVIEKKDEEKKPAVLPEDPLKDRRIAVRQHARPDQQDNPSAKFVADEANHVEKETVARQTVHDRDDENPTPGGNHPGSQPAPGDSERTRIAESEEHKGEHNRAPGEKGAEVDVAQEPKIPKPQPAAAGTPAQAAAQRPAAEPRASKGLPQPAAGGATPASPDTETGAAGDWTFNPARSGGASGSRPESSAGAQGAQAPGGKLWALPGLGQPGTPGAMNTNLNPTAIASIVGVDNLRKLREADGERRKSEHRGSWLASSFERWRSAIENYVSSVKDGNQTALNAAQVPFASYLNGMHNRIHPIFADSFLESLDSLPGSHPMNDQHLVTRLEIVLTKDGHLKKMGIVKTSGITGFDIAALDAVDRAQPFGPAPNAIVSPDGNVYLHWEFHRDEVYACSTMGAKPFILNNSAAPPNVEPTQPTQPGPSSPTRERGSPTTGTNDARG